MIRYLFLAGIQLWWFLVYGTSAFVPLPFGLLHQSPFILLFCLGLIRPIRNCLRNVFSFRSQPSCQKVYYYYFVWSFCLFFSLLIFCWFVVDCLFVSYRLKILGVARIRTDVLKFENEFETGRNLPQERP